MAINSTFVAVGDYGHWWSTDEESTSNGTAGHSMQMSNNSEDVSRQIPYKRNMLSVRCLKD